MENILLLHGALGAKSQLTPLEEALSNDFSVGSMDFSGHGGSALPDAFDIRVFAQDVLNWMDDQELSATHIFGYSMGGYVGTYLARHHPERIKSVFAIATKFNWDGPSTEKEMAMLNPEKIEEKVPKFADVLAQRHSPEDWRSIVLKTKDMMANLSEEPTLFQGDFGSIEVPILVALGDMDHTAGLADSLQVFEKLERSQFLVLPNTKHPLESVDLKGLVHHLKKFINDIQE
ncbi:MAG: alpha/beta hydrolase [Bacteroidota bacterium]